MGEAKRRRDAGLMPETPSLATQKYKIPELPPEGLREAISAAAHRAVCEETLSDGSRQCSLYAMAGAFLATHLTGNEYVFQAGAAFFGVKDGRRGRDDVDFAMIPEASGYTGYEFHAWFVRRPRGVGDGEVCRGNEFVDLSLRHIPALVASPMILGEPVEWKRTNWPDFFWGRLRELTALKIRLHPDRRVMENVGNKHDMKLAAQVAQTRLGNHRKKPSTTAANRVSEDSQRQWDDCYSAG